MIIVKIYCGLSAFLVFSLFYPHALIQERWWKTKAKLLHIP